MDAAILALALPLVKQWEGLRLAPYRCASGFATIGYGTRFYPGGKAVAMGDPQITAQEAEEFLSRALEELLKELPRRFARVPSAHQAAAMLSLAYNIGLENFAGSTLLEKFNAGDARAAAKEFPRWCNARLGGKLTVLDGLLKRRQAEAAFFLTPDAAP